MPSDTGPNSPIEQPTSRSLSSKIFPRSRTGARLLLLLLSFAVSTWNSGAQTPEQLKVTGYVSDFANVLGQSAREQLTALCTEVDQKAQAQIAIVTVKSLGGRSIEDYAIDLATRLGIGPKQINRGVLILVAVDEHKYRIEVGYGLEPILPDGKVGDIGREAVIYLRQNNYDMALMLMTRQVAEVIAADRGATLTGSEPPSSRSESDKGNWGIGQILLLFFVIYSVYAILRGMGGGRGSRFGGGWWIGPMIGGGFRGGGWGGGLGGSGGGGFGGFGGGSFGGGGASGSW